jgi:RNA polymerase sigma factor (sigma-70 family)
MTKFMHRLARVALRRDTAGLSDGQLLESYVTRHDEAAFEAIVRRHADMVMGVCRRVLADRHDAEDAFQATFLVLVRKASSIAVPRLLANWLYGVAYNVALKARAAAARRRAREKQLAEMPEPEVAVPADVWLDWLPVLDQELRRLPDKYRVAIILCEIEASPIKKLPGAWVGPLGPCRAG